VTKNIPIYVETAGRSCNGCTKCCEGWLSAEIYGYKMSPSEGGCKFLGHCGCSIYPVREQLCKAFQCGWKENCSLHENLKPDICNAIIMNKRIEEYSYVRLIPAGIIKNYVFEWAEEQARLGKHVVGYDNDGEFVIYSNDKKFKELIKKEYAVTV